MTERYLEGSKRKKGKKNSAENEQGTIHHFAIWSKDDRFKLIVCYKIHTQKKKATRIHK